MKKIFKIFLFLLLAVFLACVIFFGILVVRRYQDTRDGKKTLDLSYLPSNVSVSTAPQSPTVDDDPSYGAKGAKIIVIEFGDFECPICKRAAPELREVMEEYKDRVFFVYRDFPISPIHPQAQKAAEASQCANEVGKFWEMHDLLFENQSRLSESLYSELAQDLGINTQSFKECLSSGRYATEVKKDYYDGLLSGVFGTPTFFVNGEKLPGYASASSWRKLLDRILRDT